MSIQTDRGKEQRSTRPKAVAIMAAGRGTRMKNSERAKVMYELFERPMIHYVADLAFELGAERVIAIVGYQRETVEAYLRQTHPAVEYAVQEPQLGTGHAVLQVKRPLADFQGDLLVLSGDVPLLTRETMEQLVECHRSTGAVGTILTAEVSDPTGYGRIVRNADGSVKKIVEHRDASPAELAINEINSGIYIFEKDTLFDGLEHLNPHNVQNEYYLTDVFEYFWQHRWVVSALKASREDEIQGINTPEQLERARSIMSLRRA